MGGSYGEREGDRGGEEKVIPADAKSRRCGGGRARDRLHREDLVHLAGEESSAAHCDDLLHDELLVHLRHHPAAVHLREAKHVPAGDGPSDRLGACTPAGLGGAEGTTPVRLQLAQTILRLVERVRNLDRRRFWEK